MGVLYYILSPFSWLLNFFNGIFGNYGLAMIMLAVVVRLLMFPLTIKGKRSMIQMNLLSGKMQQLQKQYGKDKDRYNIEVQRLYEKENVNPMGGCLWSMVPMLILLPIFYIIREPLHYLNGLTVEQIYAVAQAVNWQDIAVNMGWTTQAAIDSALSSASNAAQIASGFANVGYNQLYLSSLVNEQTIPAIVDALGGGVEISTFNFSLLGLNLAAVPTWKVWETAGRTLENLGLVFLVIMSVVTMFLSTQITTRTNKMNTGNSGSGNEAADRTSKTMMYTMPLMYLWFGFIMPGVMCLYFIASSVISLVQEIIAGRILKKDYEKAREEAAEREQREKEEEKERKRQLAEERALRLEEEKKNRGKKKPAKKKPEEDTPGINKADSREGMRTYARGRAYDPNRFAGGVTPYRDPNGLISEQEAAQAARAAQRGKRKTEKPDETAQDEQETAALDAAPETAQDSLPAETIETTELTSETAPAPAEQPHEDAPDADNATDEDAYDDAEDYDEAAEDDEEDTDDTDEEVNEE